METAHNAQNNPKNTAQVFPNPFPHAFCDVFSCRNPAKWFVGRPDAPLSTCMNLCDACLRSVLASIPAEMWPKNRQTAAEKAERAALEARIGELEAEIAELKAKTAASEAETDSETAAIMAELYKTRRSRPKGVE